MLATIGVALSAAHDVALAQAGAGAERYEVTITPPKRPGTEAAPEAAVAAPTAPDSPVAATGDAATAKAVDPAGALSAPPAAPAGGTARAVAAAPTGPPRTLQVAAFRQHDRAETLRSELAESFPDVAILEIQSGGEPLYRVNVGRLQKGAELEALKKRLAAAGHPSFDVPAPARPADD